MIWQRVSGNVWLIYAKFLEPMGVPQNLSTIQTGLVYLVLPRNVAAS